MSNRARWTIVAVLLATWAYPASTFSQNDGKGNREDKKNVMMVVGEQRILEATHIESFSESTRGIIEVKIPRDGSKLILTAVRQGITSLLLISRSGAQRTIIITVFSRAPATIDAELK